MRNILLAVAAILFCCRAWAFDETRDTITKGKYTVVFINKDSGFSGVTRQRLIDTYFDVYPKEAARFNARTLRLVNFVIDPSYDGVAATDAGVVTFNPVWFQKHPEDIDVVTHEVMHIVQDYRHDPPGWLTEGIADYARFVFGVNNAAAHWTLPDYTAGQSYENAYRVTARFLVWASQRGDAQLVDRLDAALRSGKYTPSLWVKLTGKTVDALWAEYAANPVVAGLASAVAVTGGGPSFDKATAGEQAFAKATAGEAGAERLHALQQQFVDLRFGMFIHFNIPTFANQDWPDPDAPVSLFNPTRLDCTQWAAAAKSAHMSYGCLTTKHHSGFCIWDTKTTDYNVMNSPLKRDVVREYTDAFRAQGLKVCLYYSILDTHHRLRPGFITRQHIDIIKTQLTELLTNYGEITALIIDGWDAPWSRISYDDVPFEDIYTLVKTLQPNCLLMDLNSAKYPPEGLFYTDIKSYEQGAGQHISTSTNRLPALSCLPLNGAWFWKTDFPTTAVKDPRVLVEEDIVPYNKIYDNFILNVAPNREGLIDDNTLAALKEIGRLWKNDAPAVVLPPTEAPVISSNIAKHQPAKSSWSDDMNIMDFGNDDNFKTAWQSNPVVKEPWYEVDFTREQPFNMIVLTEADSGNISGYRLEYRSNGVWKPLLSGDKAGRVKLHRFATVWGDGVRVLIDKFAAPPGIAELGVYAERR
jgi:alpha-L-fucosidase